MNRAKFIGRKEYKNFAGGSWPSYDAFIAGVQASDPAIQQEIDEFVEMMSQTYQEITIDSTALDTAHIARLQQQFYNKNYIPKGCSIPWNFMGINSGGNVYLCICANWIPRTVGNIINDDIWQILNSETAQQIRQEIYHGRYYYCNNKNCSFFSKVNESAYNAAPVTDSDRQPLPFEPRPEYQLSQIPSVLTFDFDYTCNFQCPSCRTQVINNNKHHVIRSINDQIVSSIKTKIIDNIGNQPVQICWAGGEIFISEPYLDLFEYIIRTKKTNITHSVATNGSYLLKKKDLVISMLPHITMLRISFDAATAETYAKVRVGGQWDTLLENVRWLRQHIEEQNLKIDLVADYVVQQQNYHEIEQFNELAKSLGFKHINFQRILDWGTWSADEFQQHNIYNPEHPEHAKLLEILSKTQT